jgi:protein O-GlcNAc transferase
VFIKGLSTAEAWRLGVEAHQSRNFKEAERYYLAILAALPNHADANHNLGILRVESGRWNEALPLFQRAIEANPNKENYWMNYVGVLSVNNRLKDAQNIVRAAKKRGLPRDCINKLQTILRSNQATRNAKHPESAVKGLIELYNKGNMTEVVERAQVLTKQFPRFLVIWNILAAAAAQVGKFDQAAYAFKTAISLNPKDAEVFINMGNFLNLQGKGDEAIQAYNKAISLKPDYALAHYNLGNILTQHGQFAEAVAAYKKAIAITPNYADAHNNMGNALRDQGKLNEAIQAYKKAIAINSDLPEAYNNLGNVFQDKGKFDEAIAAYKKALKLKPDYGLALDGKLNLQAQICDWRELKDDLRFLEEFGVTDGSIRPFGFLSLVDAPDLHLRRSFNYAQKNLPNQTVTHTARPTMRPQRLRIGYFSADFRNHATMYLMNRVFAAHDKSQFEIFAFSYGPNVQDEMRQSLMSNVDVFHDVRAMSDLQVVELVRSERIDIAVDLKGYTENERVKLFSYGLAPIQISYLGYPGTLGADFIDYIIADPVVIPEENRRFYSENIIYLPHTYQPNDNQRVIADRAFTKEEMGLPDEGFVFCCFNNNYKISPVEFDIWMRLLGKVEGSVLWLLKSNKWSEDNLTREAEVRGISGDRLIFAEKLSLAEHLARHRLADLFLDTFNYNAHTTASDALWAGLPVLTKLGEGFAARVAGSLLSAVGLKELITENQAEYEALALKLATNPTDLAQIKSKLAANRLIQPLFESQIYTKNLERGYQLAYDRYFNGQVADTIWVTN